MSLNEQKSALAYMAEATTKLIQSTGASFENEEEFKAWCDENIEVITREASELQTEVMTKVSHSRVKITKLLSDHTYFKISRLNLNQREIDAHNKTLAQPI